MWKPYAYFQAGRKMTNEMIPISEIDSKIVELELLKDQKLTYYQLEHDRILNGMIDALTSIKQKAIPAIPISKIDTKIKELRETPDQFGSSIYYYHSEVIKRVYEELEDLKK